MNTSFCFYYRNNPLGTVANNPDLGKELSSCAPRFGQPSRHTVTHGPGRSPYNNTTSYGYSCTYARRPSVVNCGKKGFRIAVLKFVPGNGRRPLQFKFLIVPVPVGSVVGPMFSRRDKRRTDARVARQ